MSPLKRRLPEAPGLSPPPPFRLSHTNESGVIIVAGRGSNRYTSIREFCDVKTPIIMFTKNNNFAVMTMEEVPALNPSHS